MKISLLAISLLLSHLCLNYVVASDLMYTCIKHGEEIECEYLPLEDILDPYEIYLNDEEEV